MPKQLPCFDILLKIDPNLSQLPFSGNNSSLKPEMINALPEKKQVCTILLMLIKILFISEKVKILEKG